MFQDLSKTAAGLPSLVRFRRASGLLLAALLTEILAPVLSNFRPLSMRVRRARINSVIFAALEGFLLCSKFPSPDRTRPVRRLRLGGRPPMNSRLLSFAVRARRFL